MSGKQKCPGYWRKRTNTSREKSDDLLVIYSRLLFFRFSWLFSFLSASASFSLHGPLPTMFLQVGKDQRIGVTLIESKLGISSNNSPNQLSNFSRGEAKNDGKSRTVAHVFSALDHLGEDDFIDFAYGNGLLALLPSLLDFLCIRWPVGGPRAWRRSRSAQIRFPEPTHSFSDSRGQRYARRRNAESRAPYLLVAARTEKTPSN